VKVSTPMPEGFDRAAFVSLQQRLRPMFERLATGEHAPRTIVVVVISNSCPIL
jgi:hypothetical protein